MKQWLLGFALAVCLLLPLSARAEAAVVTEQEYLPYPEATYRLIYWEGEDGGLVLSRWEGEAAGALILPESIDGKPVRAIGARAFYNAAGFTGDLTIPEGITSIGQEAFSGCSGLTGGLTIPDSVVEIGYSAFQNCTGFTGSLTLGSGLSTLESSLFRGCSGFTGSLVIPGNITLIRGNAFYGCTGFSGGLTLSQGIVTIESAAFQGCTGFTGDLVIPDSVTTLGARAFYGCAGFSGSLTIGGGVTAIPEQAFSGCSGFTGSLTLKEGLTSIGSRAFSGCSGFSGTLALPSSLTQIGSSAFEDCSGFTGDLVIPDSVTEMGQNSFRLCTGFSGSLILGSGLAAIPDRAFYGCSGFSAGLTIPQGVISIGDYSFSGCSGFSGGLAVPGSVADIGSSAFSNCGFTGPLTLGDGVTSIGSSAFFSCHFSGSLILPDSVTEVGDSTFSNCSDFDGALTLGSGLTSLGAEAFRGCSGFTGPLALPSGITAVPTRAFEGCAGFSGSLILPDGLESIGPYAFDGCSGLTGSLSIPSAVTSIGKYAFADCIGFSGSLSIPGGGGATVGEHAFDGCTGFSGSLSIGGGVTTIERYAFRDCSGFQGPLTLASGLSAIETYAFAGCSGLSGNLAIPDTVTSIGNYAFQGCTGFSGDLTIGSGVSSIGERAFQNCTGFSGDLTIGGNQAVIEKEAFAGCSGFQGSLTLGSISSIGESAFSRCSGLTGDLTIPYGITSIGLRAFSNSGFAGGSLTVLGNGSTVIDGAAFLGCGFTGSLTLREIASVGESAFQDCAGFSGSLTFNRVSSIGERAFSGCAGFTGPLTIPDTVTSIGDSAFLGCAGFTSLTVGRGLTSIGAEVFQDCTGLASLNLPEGLTSLSTSCFYNCTGLEQISLPASLVQIGDYALHTSPQLDPLPAVFYHGSQEEWEALGVDTAKNNLLLQVQYDQTSGGVGEGAQHLGTVEGNTTDTVTIDSVTYPLSPFLSPAEGAYTGEFVLYTLNEQGTVTGITPLTRATGTLDSWRDRLSAPSLATLSGIEYTFSELGSRDFLLYEDLLLGEQVVFYRDSSYTVYRIEPDPDAVITRVGYLSERSDGEVTIGYHTFQTGALSVPEEYEGAYVLYQLQNLDTITSLELLATETGTLNAWNSATRTLTISEAPFSLSPLADVEADSLSGMVGYKVTYVHYEGAVYHVDWYTPAPGEFNEYVYRAEFLQNPSYDPTQAVNDVLNGDTPSEILLDAMEEEGFVVGVAAWEGVTLVADSVSDISNVSDINITPKDLYAGIILDMLEASTTIGGDTSGMKDFSKVLNAVNQWATLAFQTETVDPSTLTEAQQLELAKVIKDNFYTTHPDLKVLSDASKIFSRLTLYLKVCDSINDCVEVVYNNLTLFHLCESMKDVLRTMYTDAQRYGYPLELQLALLDCLDIINATSDEVLLVETIQDVEMIAGPAALDILVSEMWKTSRSLVELSHPGIAIIRASYSGTKLLCNIAYNTDDLVDQYWEILATTEVEHLVECTRATLASRFQRTGTVQDAQAYLSATGALFSIRRLDCDSALKYVEAVDNALISKLLNAGFGISNDEFRGHIEGIKKGYNSIEDIARWGWLEYAQSDYPEEDLSQQRQDMRTALRVVEAACPVNVYVYDQAGNLVAQVEDGRVTCTDENLAVALRGDSKTLYFLDSADYRIQLTGYDEGAMDVLVTEYDESGALVRSVSFYDVALSEGAGYQTGVSGGALETPAYVLSDGDLELAANVDTMTAPATVEAQIFNGTFAVPGDLVRQVTAPAGQTFSITAVVPEGWQFVRWSCNAGVLADPSSPSTTFRMPETGPVSITAELTQSETAPVKAIALNCTQWIAQPGDRISLSASLTPTDALHPVVWTSLDPQVATVDGSGRVTAHTVGTAIIVASTQDGLHRAACTVTVRNYQSAALLLLDGEGQELSSIPAGSFTVRATVEQGALAAEDRCLLACYTADGQMVWLSAPDTVEVLSDDSTSRLDFSVDNTQGNITQIKLFLLSPWSGLQPLASTAVYGG